MDTEEIRADLEERFPQWANSIRLLHIREAELSTPSDNDGRSILCDRRRLAHLSRDMRCFYMAQQLMHIQLAHHARRDGRDPLIWRQAADAVVNAMLRAEGFQLPYEVMLIRGAEELSAEEMYDALLMNLEEQMLPDEEDGKILLQSEKPEASQEAGKESSAHEIDLDDPGLAAAVAGLAEMLEPSMQLDFDWFPGSTIRDGMLRYEFKAYPVAYAEILLDTSASVDADLLRWFVRAVKALMKGDAVVRVGCFDTRFYGFQDVNTEEDIEKLEFQGTGGTDFNAAVNAFTGDAENQIIFTDGYAEMPEQHCDAVWVVYGTARIQPKGGRVIYAKPGEEKEKHEIDFLIT